MRTSPVTTFCSKRPVTAFLTCWVSEGSEAPEAPSEIGIRTARQLNNLSLYYEQYSPLLAKDTTLQQERSIDYSGYDWANYGRSGAAVAPPSTRAPQGHTGSDRALLDPGDDAARGALPTTPTRCPADTRLGSRPAR